MGKKIVSFGEIMLRLATPDHQRFTQVTSFDASFGGGEANVAVSLANFGLQTEYVTRLPDNDIGEACLMTLRKHNVGTNHIIRGGRRLGIYYLKPDLLPGPAVIYDRQIRQLRD
jgi:2-dehydro-3-deoxygluconokinase